MLFNIHLTHFSFSPDSEHDEAFVYLKSLFLTVFIVCNCLSIWLWTNSYISPLGTDYRWTKISNNIKKRKKLLQCRSNLIFCFLTQKILCTKKQLCSRRTSNISMKQIKKKLKNIIISWKMFFWINTYIFIFETKIAQYR